MSVCQVLLERRCDLLWRAHVLLLLLVESTSPFITTTKNHWTAHPIDELKKLCSGSYHCTTTLRRLPTTGAAAGTNLELCINMSKPEGRMISLASMDGNYDTALSKH